MSQRKAGVDVILPSKVKPRRLTSASDITVPECVRQISLPQCSGRMRADGGPCARKQFVESQIRQGEVLGFDAIVDQRSIAKSWPGEMVEAELSFRLWYNPDRGSDKTRTNPQSYLALPHSVFIPRADVSEAKRSSHPTP